MAKERHRPCGEPGCDGRVMTSENQRQYNHKNEEGRVRCPECVVRDIYARFGR